VGLCTEGEGHEKDVGHNLDDVYGWVRVIARIGSGASSTTNK
jgi:hypothetical protein